MVKINKSKTQKKKIKAKANGKVIQNKKSKNNIKKSRITKKKQINKKSKAKSVGVSSIFSSFRVKGKNKKKVEFSDKLKKVLPKEYVNYLEKGYQGGIDTEDKLRKDYIKFSKQLDLFTKKSKGKTTIEKKNKIRKRLAVLLDRKQKIKKIKNESDLIQIYNKILTNLANLEIIEK
jgi:hypothetical protein